MGKSQSTSLEIARELLFLLAVGCILAVPAYAQYEENFDNLLGTAAGLSLTNQAGFSRSGAADFFVYTYDGNSFGIVRNPKGGSKFIAGIGPGPDMSASSGAKRTVPFGSGGIWEISYDLAVTISGASTTGLEAIGMFQIFNQSQGSIASAFFRNWLRWSAGGAGSQQLPGPFDIGYFGFTDSGDIFSFYGDTPGQDWSHLPFNRWHRVTIIVDFDTNKILLFGIQDLHSGGSRTTFMPPGNVFLNGGALVPPGTTCTQRSATPSSPGECYLLPDALDFKVYNEHVLGGRNVFALDNIRIVAAADPRAGGYLYDNGPARGTGASAIGHGISADDFRLAADATVACVSVDVSDGAEEQNRRWDGTIEWWIFADSSGGPGSVVASGRGVHSRIRNMRESPTGPRDYTVVFDLGQDVPLLHDQTYWLGLHMQEGYDRMSVFWEYTAPFASDGEGSAPTNATFPAWSGGELVNGLPSFPAQSVPSGGRELAFRFTKKQRCFTLGGRTYCLSVSLARRTISIAAILAGAFVARTGWNIWRKRKIRRQAKSAG